MVGSLVVGLLVSVTVHVHPNPCTSSTAVQAAVQAVTQAPIRLDVAPTAGGLRVHFMAANQPVTIRDVPVAAADCPLVPQVIALMTQRYVRALPAYTWAPRAPPQPLRMLGQLSLSNTPLHRRHRYALAWGLDVGGGRGLTGPGWAAQVRAHVDLSQKRWGLAVPIGLRWEPSIALQQGGSVRWLTGWLGVAGFVQGAVGPVPLRGELGVCAGFSAGQAQGFEGASADTVALVETQVRGVMLGPWGLYGGVEARLNLVGPRFADYRAPRLRLGLVLGIRKDVAFF